MSDYSIARQDEEQGRGKATGKNRKGSEAIAGYCFLVMAVILVGVIAWHFVSKLFGL